MSKRSDHGDRLNLVPRQSLALPLSVLAFARAGIVVMRPLSNEDTGRRLFDAVEGSANMVGRVSLTGVVLATLKDVELLGNQVDQLINALADNLPSSAPKDVTAPCIPEPRFVPGERKTNICFHTRGRQTIIAESRSAVNVLNGFFPGKYSADIKRTRELDIPVAVALGRIDKLPQGEMTVDCSGVAAVFTDYSHNALGELVVQPVFRD